MALRTVEFEFITGLARPMFSNARLRGSWDVNGRYSDDWTESPMHAGMGPDGCPMFRGSVALDLAHAGKTFKWGVVLDGPQGANFWGIPTEVQDVNSAESLSAIPHRDRDGPAGRTLLLHLLSPVGREQTFRRGRRRAGPAICRLGAQREAASGSRLRQTEQRLHCR